ncbi:MAG: hypothetical protein HKN24_09830 [Acidimicrobiales bacterium]|nr:hypothetical protein [Acidimicrobiales bacterium]
MRRTFTMLIALALAIGACGSGADDSVTVSGTEVCLAVAAQGDERARYECVDTLDDERVSGNAIVTVTMIDSSATPVAEAGEFSLENDGGSWSGDWSGVIEEDGRRVAEGIMLGSGAYEGLQFRGRWVSMSTADIEVSGTIEPAR